MPTPVTTKTIFCAREQKDTVHALTPDKNGEIVAECAACNGFLKFPSGLTPDQLDTLIAEHGEVNVRTTA